MRVIDADALKKALVEHMDAFVDSDGSMMYSDHLLCDADYEDLCEFIDKQSTIQPEPHWIPVTERLPEVGKDVLLSYFDEITIGWLNSDSLWSIYDGWKCVSADEIFAWMPLPEPFKGVTE